MKTKPNRNDFSKLVQILEQPNNDKELLNEKYEWKIEDYTWINTGKDMGCDIHLMVEIRVKEDTEMATRIPNRWYDCGFRGQFSSRIYGMFARMADVRSYGDGDVYKVQFKPRGLP